MADIQITVGILPDIDYSKFKSEIEKIAGNLEKDPIKIKVVPDVSEARKEFASLRKDIEAISKTKINIKANNAFAKTMQSGFTSMLAYVDNIKQVSTALETIGKAAGQVNFDGINRLVETAEGLKDIKISFDESGITSIKDQIQQLIDSLSHLKIAPDAENGFKVIVDDAKKISTDVEKANKSAAELTRRTSEYNKDSTKASKVTSTYVDPETGTVTSVSEVAKKNGDLEVSSTRVTESFRTEEQAAKEAAAAELELANVKKQIAQFNVEIETKQRGLANAGGADTKIYSDLEEQKTRAGNLQQIYSENGITAFRAEMAKLRTEFIESKSQADEFVEAERRASSAAKQASQSTKAVTEDTLRIRAARKEIVAESDNIYKSYSSIMKQLTDLPANDQNTADLDALKSKYLEIQQAVEHIREAKDDTTQSDVDNVQKSISDMQELINTIKERIRVEKEAADAAKEAANARTYASDGELDLRAAKRDIFADNSNINKAYTNLKKDITNLPSSEQNTADLNELVAKYKEVQKAIESIKDAGNAVTQEQIGNAQKEISEMQNLIKVIKKRVDTEKEAAKANKGSSKDIISDEAAIKKYESSINKLQSAIKKYSTAKNSANESSRKAYKDLQDEEKVLTDVFNKYQNNTASIEEFYAEIEKSGKVLNNSTSVIRSNGDASQTLMDRLGNLASRFASWLSVSQVIMYAVNAMQNMVRTSIELDTAMTELKKVTDESDATYNQFLENASERATKLGTSLTDVVSSTADFARLGYNIKDASELADVATIYKNVGDGINDISEASESIIATMQAFGMSAEDAMSIVDKFNAVGKLIAEIHGNM